MYMSLTVPDHEWKKGSAELLVLSLLEDQPRHGYDISKLIQIRSGGALRFHVKNKPKADPSLRPTPYGAGLPSGRHLRGFQLPARLIKALDIVFPLYYSRFI
jgi:hypothetical protein